MVTQENWKASAGIILTEEQNAVIRANKNIAVVAGPGTGKTEALAQKAVYLLQTDLCKAPFKILALSYKVDAASNIKERVKKRCPKDLVWRFHSLTLDAFLVSIVRRFCIFLPDWLKIMPDFDIVNTIDQTTFLISKSKPMETDVSSYKNKDILETPSEDIKDFYIYSAEKNELDYAMIKSMSFFILKQNEKLRKIISQIYKYIFLDEFQDINNIHYDIVKMLFCNNKNIVTAVGDYNQAIMSFAGALPNSFNMFKSDYNSGDFLQFSYNHRSSTKIVEFINKIIPKVTPKEYIHIEYKSTKEMDANSFVAVKTLNTKEEEAEYILKCINKIKNEDNLSFGDFAVILKQRVSDYIECVNNVLTRENINFRNEDALICSKGVSYQDLVCDNFSKFIIFSLMLKNKNISKKDYNEFCNTLITLFKLDLEKSRDLKKMNDYRNKIISLNLTTPEKWVEEMLHILSPKAVSKKLYNNEKEYKKHKISIIHLLQSCINKYGNNLNQVIDEYIGVNAVKFMTSHKSKGLEFNTVFFADFTNDSWWSLGSGENSRNESLRCFFVGLSRAKQRLFFTNSTTQGWPKDIADILNDTNMLVRYNI